MGIVCIALTLYWLAILVRIILSWFPIGSSSPIAPVNSFLFAITEPVLGPVRRAIPPIRLGAMGLDLSPIIVLFGVSIVRSFICR
jgi:YggT family protein